MKFFYGIIGILVGFLLIKYSIALTDMFGSVAWAERNLRGGMAGTYTLYRIVGMVFIVLSMLYIFGGLGFLLSPLGSVFGGVSQ